MGNIGYIPDLVKLKAADQEKVYREMMEKIQKDEKVIIKNLNKNMDYSQI